jgi:pyruvate dehydrogenase E2 component (dihydrolipoamide acetyltransferase)
MVPVDGATTSVFRMPSLGADMTDGVVTEWLVAPGDEVTRGQIVAVVETDKSDIEVEVFEDARIVELLVPEGERVEVGHPIAVLLPHGARVVSPVSSSTLSSSTVPTAVPTAPAASAVTSPLVRHLAEELHVDVAAVHGTGRGGRIVRADVEAAAAAATAAGDAAATGAAAAVAARDAAPPAVPAMAGASRPQITPRARRLAVERGLDPAVLHDRWVADGHGDEPLTGDVVADLAAALAAATGPTLAPAPAVDPMRAAIAALMARSWREIPHFHVTRRIDLGDALTGLSAANEARPVTERVLPAAMVLHAVAAAAAAVPAVNGWWVDGRFEPSPRVDLGVVVSLRRGGIVAPTISGADTMTVEELMARLDELVGRARRGRLRSSDTVPASLTVTNLGDRGADSVAGVIHPPQVALVGLGTVHDEPWVHEGEVVVRPVLHATLTGDHRALDGLVGATFLHRLATLLQEAP